jgi:hypothetical protein
MRPGQIRVAQPQGKHRPRNGGRPASSKEKPTEDFPTVFYKRPECKNGETHKKK